MDEKLIDHFGVQIKPGDILEQVDLNPGNAPWRYFVCYTYNGELIEVRDLNANNVGMCCLGVGGDVKRIGHITEVYERLEAEGYWDSDDWMYYFSIPNSSVADDPYGVKELSSSEIKEYMRLNNFPEGWELVR